MWIVFGGTCAGYLAYDWIHFYTHHGRNPRTWIGKTLRTAHAAHHYSVFHLNMGISTPLWDVVFGTFGWSKDRMRAALKESRAVENSQG
jgi:sterol desaturase/sphingolipid hydroxylase (fatty acid hydroxylase superfamily)